jgi:polo-like kinase 4
MLRPPCIDDYDVGQEVGRGGFAVVHRARDRATGRDVAIKIIGKKRMQSMGMMSRIVNEIEVHAPLKHANIVSLIDYFEDPESIYIVLELCKGDNLYKYLRTRGRLDEMEAVLIIEQLLDAVEYLHHRNVIHRDLKLSNIIFVRNGVPHVKVCDFGFAVIMSHPDEEHFTLCGTPNYIAPEIASQKAHGFPVDLWSIGCLFYSMVVGIPPFEETDVKATLERIISGAYNEPIGLLSQTALEFLRSLLHLVR